MSKPTDKERQAMLEGLVAEELRKPMAYFFHDSNARSDPKLELLRDEHGWAAMGRYWALVELLAEADSHLIEVRRPQQWKRLANALEFEDVAEAREFVGWLEAVGLIDREALAGGHVMSARLHRNAEKMAEGIARKRLGGVMTNR